MEELVVDSWWWLKMMMMILNFLSSFYFLLKMRIWVDSNQEISNLSISSFLSKTCFPYNSDILHTNLIEMKEMGLSNFDKLVIFSKHITLDKLVTLHLSPQWIPISKHSQYFLRQWDFLQLHPIKWWHEMVDEIRDGRW